MIDSGIKWICIWSSIFYVHLFTAQDRIVDSLKKRLEEDSVRIFQIKKYLPILIFDSRNSVISTAPINIIGIQAGVVFQERDVMGVGGYKIYLPFEIINNSYLYRLRVFYFTAFYQKVLLDRRYHEIDIMSELGLGRFKLNKLVNGYEELIKEGNFNPLGVSALYTLKPLKWLGIRVMLGYRWMLQKEFYDTFSEPFYSVGMWFSVKDFIRFIRYNCIVKRRYKRMMMQVHGLI